MKIYALLLGLVVMLASCDTVSKSTSTVKSATKEAVIETKKMAGEDVKTHSVTFMAKVPEDTGTVYVTGSIPELGSWAADGLEMTATSDPRVRTASISVDEGTTAEFKFTLGTWETEALGPDGDVPENKSFTVDKDLVFKLEVVQFKSE